MAKPNYQHERRQKDLARKKKQEEKRKRKMDKNNAQPKEPAPAADTPETTS